MPQKDVSALNTKSERLPAVWKATKQKVVNEEAHKRTKQEAAKTAKQEATKAPKVDNSPSVDFKYPGVDLDRVSEVKLVIRDKKTKAKVGTVTIPMKTVGDKLKPQDEPILRVNQEGSERKRVVGTISLTISRIKNVDKKCVDVYARQLRSSMDFWSICPTELLKTTLHDRKKKLTCSFLAAGPPFPVVGKLC